MRLDAALVSARRACSAGLDSVTLRREVASRLSRVICFDAHAFNTCDPDTGLMTHVVADGIPPSLAEDYVQRLYPHYLALISMDVPRTGQQVFSMCEQSREAREALFAHGFRSHLIGSLTSAGRVWGTWCLMRADESESLDARTRAVLQQLAPDLGRALQSAALLDQGLDAARGTATASSPGVLVLDPRNRQALRTPQAAAFLEDLADVGLRMSGDIPLSIFGLVSRLRSSRILVPHEVHARARGHSGRWYLLRASLAEPDAAGECAVVVVMRPAIPREVATILTRLYDLSPREREVVAGVARGEPTKCIAAELGLSPHTVREHIDRACEKMGVRGRKALVAKLFVDGYAPLLNAQKATLDAIPTQPTRSERRASSA